MTTQASGAIAAVEYPQCGAVYQRDDATGSVFTRIKSSAAGKLSARLLKDGEVLPGFDWTVIAAVSEGEAEGVLKDVPVWRRVHAGTEGGERRSMRIGFSRQAVGW